MINERERAVGAHMCLSSTLVVKPKGMTQDVIDSSRSISIKRKNPGRMSTDWQTRKKW